ncbi:hypothetical protein GCM10023094_36630 [Rhodococcus olei]|uniref:Uncharacterized protein n=1 Tax=Rhodococcus olei TaxID=2161675 RepID=A0ABP8P958_9NOCA
MVCAMTGNRNRRTRTLSLRRICLLGLALPALVGGCAATADPAALETPATAMRSDSLAADIAGLEVRHGT